MQKAAALLALMGASAGCRTSGPDSSQLQSGNPLAATPPYCLVEKDGAQVEMVRPHDTEAKLTSVNWLAQPVPDAKGHRVVGVTSLGKNQLYDLTAGKRLRIPGKSDAVATPDGLYVTLPPRHGEPDNTLRFYPALPMLESLRAGGPSSMPEAELKYKPRGSRVWNAFAQSTGILKQQQQGDSEITVYRVLFAGDASEAFRLVDVTARKRNDQTTLSAGAPKELCDGIFDAEATPALSKDARYIIANAKSSATDPRPKSLRIYALSEDMKRCEEKLDFGFEAGRADFAFDNSMVAFHISRDKAQAVFVADGVAPRNLTDVVVARLVKDAGGGIVDVGGMARVTTSTLLGRGAYLPSFFPDGRLVYVYNAVPSGSPSPTYKLKVVDPQRELFAASIFKDDAKRGHAARLGELWRASCQPDWAPFGAGEAPWYFLSMTREQCTGLVIARHSGADADKAALLAQCAERP
jgi:hypothetical protein